MDLQTFINLTDAMVDVSGSAFKILTLIARCDDCSPLSYSTIRAKTNIASDATIHNCLKRLIELGLIMTRPYFEMVDLPPSVNASVCNICGNLPHNHYSLDRHHIIPTSLGGVDEPENITFLCHDCHIAIHTNCYKFIQETEEQGQP